MNEDHGPVSKPLILIGVLLVLLVASAFIPARWLGVKPQANAYTPVDFTKLANVNSYAQDVDGNGQISWGELIGSTAEGEEAITDLENAQPDPKVIAQLNDPNNLTASFSKNLYTVSTYLANNNVTDAASQQSVLDELIAEEAAKITPTTYTYKDLHTTKAETATSIRAYGNAIASILSDAVTENSITNDFGAMENFASSSDPQYLPLIEQDHERIDAKVQKLLALSIPVSATTYHLIAVNRLALYNDILRDLAQAQTDPLRATIAFQKYMDVTVAVLRTYQTIAPYFDIKKIVFTSKEPGYAFTAGYTPH